MEKKSKQYYSLLIGKKAQLPSAAGKLQKDFNFSLDQLKQLFTLPHKVTLEPYVRAFQYKVLKLYLVYQFQTLQNRLQPTGPMYLLQIVSRKVESSPIQLSLF